MIKRAKVSVGKTGKNRDKTEVGAERKERLVAELRANLKRRKARSRGTREASAEDGKQGE